MIDCKKKAINSAVGNINDELERSIIPEIIDHPEDENLDDEIREISFLEDKNPTLINAELLKFFHEMHIEFHKKNHIIESLNRESHIIEFRISISPEFHGKISEYDIFISQYLLIFILYSHIYPKSE